MSKLTLQHFSGPSGLLLAHKLIKSQIPITKLDLYESRSDPRDEQSLGARVEHMHWDWELEEEPLYKQLTMNYGIQ